jgi:hypothetical protein
MIESGASGTRRQREIIAAKFRRFRKWAAAGKNAHLYETISFMEREFGAVDMYHWTQLKQKHNWTSRDEMIEYLEAEEPELYQAIQSALEFISSHKGLKSVTNFAFRGILDVFGPSILEALTAHPTLTSLSLWIPETDELAESVSKLLTSDNCKLEKLTLVNRPQQDKGTEKVFDALSASTAPIKAISVSSLTPDVSRVAVSLLSRTSPTLQELSISLGRDPTGIAPLYSFLAENDSEISLRLNFDPFSFLDPTLEANAEKEAYLKYIRSKASKVGPLMLSLTESDRKWNDEVVAAVCESRLRELDVSSRSLGDQDSIKIISANGSSLRAIYCEKNEKRHGLQFSGNKVLSAVVSSCMKGDDSKCKIKTLLLSGTDLSDEAVSELFEALLAAKAPRLRTLAISFVRAPQWSNCINQICTYLADNAICSLESLDLPATLSEANLIKILSALATNTTIRRFSLFKPIECYGPLLETCGDELGQAFKDLCKANHSIQEMTIPCRIEDAAEMCERNSQGH